MKYVPFFVSFFEKVPLTLVGEVNLLGPDLTATLWARLPPHFHVTVVPFFTVTVGTPDGLTNQLSPTLTVLVAASAGIASTASSATVRARITDLRMAMVPSR